MWHPVSKRVLEGKYKNFPGECAMVEAVTLQTEIYALMYVLDQVVNDPHLFLVCKVKEAFGVTKK